MHSKVRWRHLTEKGDWVKSAEVVQKVMRGLTYALRRLSVTKHPDHLFSCEETLEAGRIRVVVLDLARHALLPDQSS
jgi:hypothetical protein